MLNCKDFVESSRILFSNSRQLLMDLGRVQVLLNRRIYKRKEKMRKRSLMLGRLNIFKKIVLMKDHPDSMMETNHLLLRLKT